MTNIKNNSRKALYLTAPIALAISAILLLSNISLSALEESAIVKLTTEEMIIEATVPTELPIHMDKDGDIIVSNDAKIVNDSPARIRVDKVTFDTQNGWTIQDFDNDFSDYKVDSKNIGLVFNNDKVTDSLEINTNATNWPGISPSDNLPIDYEAKVSFQKDATNVSPVQVMFHIGWDEI